MTYELNCDESILKFSRKYLSFHFRMRLSQMVAIFPASFTNNKQVTSVKVAVSPKLSFCIRLLSNTNRHLMRVFENFQGGTEHLFS